MSKSKFALAGVLSAFCLAAQAAPVTFLAADNAVSSLAQMVNSTAMAANFIAASGALNVVDFESAIPAGLTITVAPPPTTRVAARSAASTPRLAVLSSPRCLAAR